ncbi:unnamed protein product [Meganyctiphanes norvegica]|uniref:Uncharacterized protein n=1 Tax=Meganyctiphanes norvegica TaxID=48144 RepID=A0AAV2RMR8_MEGNR
MHVLQLLNSLICVSCVYCYVASQNHGKTSNAQGLDIPHIPVKSNYEENICPDPDEIWPCQCVQEESDGGLSMICHDVQDSVELRRVFKADFPTTNFSHLYMFDNYGVRVLDAGIFGNVTFTHFSLTFGALKEVHEGALQGSTGTVVVMDFNGNRIHKFDPLSNLSIYPKLKMVDLCFNHLPSIPSVMLSDSITHLNISYNPIGELPIGAFAGLTQLKYAHIWETGLSDIKPGIFTDIDTLEYVSLEFNQLEYLPVDAVTCTNCNLTMVDLNHNYRLREVEPGAITITPGMQIDLYGCNMTQVQEATWRPVLQQQAILWLYENPLECGCDIAWLVRQKELLKHVKGAICSDGSYIRLKDPADYDICP